MSIIIPAPAPRSAAGRCSGTAPWLFKKIAACASPARISDEKLSESLEDQTLAAIFL
ncbi:hypothetical protein ABE607_02805 [Comamonas aquatica]|uniref:hypothetical protein n=1 Tax=Comamonas aquatica TaxID=225991 RepID=UPI0012E040D6|nr:hypothetical protein [Comamonas aquatica]MDH1901473.1 hypothetical protein [Comamonas aquatica]WBM41519.1 hypothetical protein M2J84_15715 [Comamonas aquatica]